MKIGTDTVVETAFSASFVSLLGELCAVSFVGQSFPRGRFAPFIARKSATSSYLHLAVLDVMVAI
jgi:hypothetical protein